MRNIFEDDNVKTVLLAILVVAALIFGLWLDVTDHEYIRSYCSLTGNTEIRNETHYDTITHIDSDGNMSYTFVPYHVDVEYYQYHCEDDKSIHDTWRNYRENVPQIDLNELIAQ